MRLRLLAALGAAALVLTGCAVGTPASAPSSDAGSASGIALPPAGADFDYQLGGGYTPPDGVQIVARDSTDTPSGLYDICYVNGFQTQPGEGADWLASDPDLVLTIDGRPHIDPGWPDEYLLDTSRGDKRERIAARLAPIITGCADHGFDAVEFDNLDSWTRSEGAMTFDDNVALARLLADQAHAAGLAVGQKNGAGDSARLESEVGFDYAVTEECLRYEECADYIDAYGERVYDIEYETLDCGAADRPVSVILRDHDLSTPDSPDYVRDTCG